MDKFGPFDSSVIGKPARQNWRVDMKLERQLIVSGYPIVAGVDEAGRGPIAGPVVAAAVVLDGQNIPAGLDDSKKLTPARREALFSEILMSSAVAIATANSELIDSINIRQATLNCMSRAVAALSLKVDWSLIDGRDIPQGMARTATAVIKGDGRSKSIAAASIVAKVTRDAMMTAAARDYPQYGFEQHKGYGTLAHRNALIRYGPCPLHRKSFAPIREL